MAIDTGTAAFQEVIQSSADAIDARGQGEKAGVIQDWMTEDEAIAIVLAWKSSMDERPNLAAQLIHSVLSSMCRKDIEASFKDFYLQIRRNQGFPAEPGDVFQENALFTIDAESAFHTGRGLGWRRHWCPFREPFSTAWNSIIR